MTQAVIKIVGKGKLLCAEENLQLYYCRNALWILQAYWYRYLIDAKLFEKELQRRGE